MLAAQAIKAGDGDLYIAGGMESMSNAAYLLTKARTGYRMGDAPMVDSVVSDGLWCAFEHVHMGEEAEVVADMYHVSRDEQDQFAYQSHMKAHAATEAGLFRTDGAGGGAGEEGYPRLWTATRPYALIPVSKRWPSCRRPFASRVEP